MMLTPQVSSIGPLANVALVHPEALLTFLQKPDFVINDADVDTFVEILPCLEQRLALEGVRTNGLRDHIATLATLGKGGRTVQDILRVAQSLEDISPDRYRCATDILILSGQLSFDTHSASPEIRNFCGRYATNGSVLVDTEHLLEYSLRFAWLGIQSLLREPGGRLDVDKLRARRDRMLNLYPLFFAAQDETLDPNPLLLRQRIGLAIQKNVEKERLEWENIYFSPDIYISVGAEIMAPSDFVEATTRLAEICFQNGLYYTSAYLCQATFDEAHPSFEPQDPDLQNLFNLLAQSYHALKCYPQALGYYEKILGIQASRGDEENIVFPIVAINMVCIHLLLGNYEKAGELLELLLSTHGQLQAQSELYRAFYLKKMGFVHEAFGSSLKARSCYQEMLQIQFDYLNRELQQLLHEMLAKEGESGSIVSVYRAISVLKNVFERATAETTFDPSALWRLMEVDWNSCQCKILVGTLLEASCDY